MNTQPVDGTRRAIGRWQSMVVLTLAILIQVVPSMPVMAQALVSGLQGPSGNAIGPDGALYVPEGAAGRVSRIDPTTGEVTTFAEGLPSSLIGVGGAVDIAFIDETAYVLVTLVGPDVDGEDVDGIYRMDGPESFTVIADLGQFSADNPPTTEFELANGNQYALEVYDGGFLVSDGHHNRVLRVTLEGSISEFVAFDDVVPTGMAISGNTVYLTQAGPTPHNPEDGKVVTIGAETSAVTEIASGARLLVDVEFGSGNKLYALSHGEWDGQFAGSPAFPDTGSLVEVDADGGFTVIAADLDRPTSMAFIGDTAYIVSLAGEITEIDNVSQAAGESCVDRGFNVLENQVLNSYVAYYGRPADWAGLAYWAKRLDDEGGDLSSIINAFGVSEEFDERFGDLSAEGLITNLYQQLFNRDPEPGGFAFWLDEFTSGRRSLQNIALSILDGAQNEDLTIVTNRNLVSRHFVTQSECAGIELPESTYNSLLNSVNEATLSTNAACMLVDDTIESQGGVCTHDTWTSKSDLPAASVAVSTCVVGGKLYAFGLGHNLPTGDQSKQVEAYDPVTDTWTRRADLPTARSWSAASAVNGKCYVIGGGGVSDSSSLTAVEEYDPQTDTWRSRSPLPGPRDATVSAAVNGKIYLLGGEPVGAWAAAGAPETYVYDPATNQWSRGADIPTPRGGVAGAAIDGYIYIVGGSTENLNLTDVVHRYDPVNDEWSVRASLPVRLAWATASAYGGSLYVFGGTGAENTAGAIASAYRYDPKTDQWMQLPDLPAARQSVASDTIGGRIYIIGGRSGRLGVDLVDVDEYTP